MKSRMTIGSISAKQNRDIAQIVAEHERQYRQATGERLVLAAILALSDRFGFGQKRAQRFAAAFCEIISGYAEDAYPDKACTDMSRMNDALKAELKRRKIEI